MYEPYDYEGQRQVLDAKWEAHFPKCEECGEHIVEDDYYYEEDGAYYHWECFEEKFKKSMPDWRNL